MTVSDSSARLTRDVAGSGVVGIYQHGSAVLGGLRPHSDIDLFVVLDRGLTGTERRTLLRELLKISGDPAQGSSVRPVELTAVVRSAVRPWRYPPEIDFQYGEWHGEWLRADYESGLVPMSEPSPDLAPLITMVLSANAPLFGPPPAEVLDPVPPEHLRQALLDGVPDLLADLETDTRNVVLTLARIWTTLATGVIRSKDEAATWALARLPADHRPVLARARSIYLGDEDERWDDLELTVRAHVDHVLDQIRALETPPNETQ